MRIHGRVQGVFFRSSVRKQARRLGLKGFVRNEPDGTVRVEAEGDGGAIKGLADWCREGPPLARVKKIEARPGEIEGYENFEVKY